MKSENTTSNETAFWNKVLKAVAINGLAKRGSDLGAKLCFRWLDSLRRRHDNSGCDKGA